MVTLFRRKFNPLQETKLYPGKDILSHLKRLTMFPNLVGYYFTGCDFGNIPKLVGYELKNLSQHFKIAGYLI